MMDMIIDIVKDALLDSVRMLPFLYAAFLLMEFAEHHTGDKLARLLEKAGGSLVGGAGAGALLGCVPQCGFSIAASNLYASGMIGAGTLMAVFISTSDEALPVLLAHPDMAGDIWLLLISKVLIGAAAGVLFGWLMNRIIKDKETHFDEICTDCGCEKHGIWISAALHTLKIFLFILIVNLIMCTVMTVAGADRVSAFLDSLGFFQPFAAGLVGLIPNCAASVILTELYASGSIPFGTALGGLCSGAGMGLAVLFRANKNMKINFIFLGYLYAVGVISAILVNAFFC